MKPILQIRKGWPTPALLLATLLLLILIPLPVAANPPSSVSVSYGPLSSELSVAIVHPVMNIPNHYINEVKLTVNGNIVNDTAYAGQSSDTVTYTYPLVLQPGDVVEATASCSIAGSGSGTYIVPGPAATTQGGPGQPSAPTQSAPAALVVVGAGIAVVLAIRQRI